MSDDRNRWQQTAARESLYGRNSSYGRPSVQSGYGGQEQSGRRSSRLSPVEDRSSMSRKTSNMAVINPPAINSNKRKSVKIHTPSRTSTAYYSPKNDSENLKCRICENVYTHPVILPCQHTFCFGCIATICSDDYVNEVVCPTCQKICPFPNGTMMNLPLNNLACNIMMDLGLTDKILIRDELIRILKQFKQRHHAVVVQQPSSSEPSADSSETDDRSAGESQTRLPDDSVTTLQEYEPEYNGEWKKGLCECCDPGCKCRKCCITCCLWPMTISRNAEAVGLSNSYTWPWMLTFSIGLCFCTSCLTRAVLRTQIRKKYGIPGSHCKDCCVTCCCPMCTLCQEESQLNTMSKLSLSDEDISATLKPAQGPSDELKSQFHNEDINNIILSDLDIGQYLGYIGAQRGKRPKEPISINEIDINIGGSQSSLQSENCLDNYFSSCSNEV